MSEKTNPKTINGLLDNPISLIRQVGPCRSKSPTKNAIFGFFVLSIKVVGVGSCDDGDGDGDSDGDGVVGVVGDGCGGGGGLVAVVWWR